MMTASKLEKYLILIIFVVGCFTSKYAAALLCGLMLLIAIHIAHGGVKIDKIVKKFFN